ncbi:hypothetical protein VITFI_CDS0377 [Vitreoscilla filiformis]|uniref:Uncharacterized protein n=1 Tax=Vitreoscilla filiformis TaxID=63 RepID=A0A221KAX3_VITFI|nr:hypothetical protein [Vitreoscilla filiformis]ASM76156.1 hypothetical protein VITFI_CDS0377 [Vitreoscilla filiformis]
MGERERFEQEIGGAGAQGVDGGVQVGIGGHEDDFAGVALLAQLVQPLDAGAARQGDVQQDQVVVALRGQRHRLFDAAGGVHPRPPVTHGALQEADHAGLIVHHQQVGALPVAERGGGAVGSGHGGQNVSLDGRRLGHMGRNDPL